MQFLTQKKKLIHMVYFSPCFCILYGFDNIRFPFSFIQSRVYSLKKISPGQQGHLLVLFTVYLDKYLV